MKSCAALLSCANSRRADVSVSCANSRRAGASVSCANSRRAPSTFNDLIGPALGCLPANACRRSDEDRQRLKLAVEAAAVDGANDWPGAALALFQQLCGISMGMQAHLPVGMIGAALDAAWAEWSVPLPVRQIFDGREFQARHAWQLRRDICDFEGETL